MGYFGQHLWLRVHCHLAQIAAYYRTMLEVAPKLWIGSQADFDELDQFDTQWAIVHAARDPYHRQALGYTGRGAPKDDPEYLWAKRGKRLILNLIDGDDPKYVGKPLIDAAIRHIEESLAAGEFVLVNCNKGCSRAPTIAMLYLAPTLPQDFEEAVAKFTEIYPTFAPAKGMREFARIHWSAYRNRKSADPGDKNLDTAREIWCQFCDDLKCDPSTAQAKLIAAIQSALRTAAEPNATERA